jgi:translation initiation factor 5
LRITSGGNRNSCNYCRSKKDKTAKGAAKASLPTPETASNESGGEEDEGLVAGDIDVNAFPDAANGGDDDDWGEDTTPEAVAARMKDLSTDAVKKLTDGDEEGSGRMFLIDKCFKTASYLFVIGDSLEVFAEFVTTHASNDKDIIEKAESLSIRDDKVCVVLAQIIFDTNILKENQVKKRAPLLKKFLKSEKCQKGLLGGLERFLGLEPNRSTLLAKAPIVLKAFYDEDLLEEEVVLAWADKVSKKYIDKKTAAEIREKAAPFINWLREADEEGSDEEEDD